MVNTKGCEINRDFDYLGLLKNIYNFAQTILMVRIY